MSPVRPQPQVGVRDLHDEVVGAVPDQRDESAAEGGDYTLGAFAVRDGTVAFVVQRLLDEVVLDDVRAAGLPAALEDHDAADLGHAGGVADLRAPRRLELTLDRRDRSGRLTRHDDLVNFALAGEVDAHLGGRLPHPQGVGRRRADGRDAHVDDAAAPGTSVVALPVEQHEAADLLARVVRAPEPDERAVGKREQHDVAAGAGRSPTARSAHISEIHSQSFVPSRTRSGVRPVVPEVVW